MVDAAPTRRTGAPFYLLGALSCWKFSTFAEGRQRHAGARRLQARSVSLLAVRPSRGMCARRSRRGASLLGSSCLLFRPFLGDGPFRIHFALHVLADSAGEAGGR